MLVPSGLSLLKRNKFYYNVKYVGLKFWLHDVKHPSINTNIQFHYIKGLNR